MEKKRIIGIVCFIVLWWVSVIITYQSNRKHQSYNKKYIEEVYGNIQFKGEILQLHQIRRGGRTYGLMCIKLDYTNTNSFYRFDNEASLLFRSEYKMSCLQIKNNVAVFPVGFLGNDERYDKRENAILNAKYIEVNIDNSRQVVYIDSIGNRFSTNLAYPSNNLKEEDLQLCR